VLGGECVLLVKRRGKAAQSLGLLPLSGRHRACDRRPPAIASRSCSRSARGPERAHQLPALRCYRGALRALSARSRRPPTPREAYTRGRSTSAPRPRAARLLGQASLGLSSISARDDDLLGDGPCPSGAPRTAAPGRGALPSQHFLRRVVAAELVRDAAPLRGNDLVVDPRRRHRSADRGGFARERAQRVVRPVRARPQSGGRGLHGPLGERRGSSRPTARGVHLPPRAVPRDRQPAVCRHERDSWRHLLDDPARAARASRPSSSSGASAVKRALALAEHRQRRRLGAPGTRRASRAGFPRSGPFAPPPSVDAAVLVFGAACGSTGAALERRRRATVGSSRAAFPRGEKAHAAPSRGSLIRTSGGAPT